MRTGIILFLLYSGVSPAGIGINLNFPERGPGGTFIDLAKENYRWIGLVSNQSLAPSEVDAYGWPTVDVRYVVDYRPVAEWAGSIDDPEEYRIDVSGTYQCSFKGQASISCWPGGISNQVYDNGTNTTTFNYTVSSQIGPGHGFFTIDFSQTRRTAGSPSGSGFTEFKMIKPGYSPNRTNPFSDELINAIGMLNPEALRFMDFLTTNDVEPDYPDTIGWAQRKLRDDASQRGVGTIGKTGGAAWEVIIDLANRVQRDVWINVPLAATPNYVQNLATLLQDSLNPSLNIYVESSNEVWNGIFPQQDYNLADAQARGIGEQENHARRTAELAQIFESVFGASAMNQRIRVILCSHAPMLKWWVRPMLNFLDSAFGTPSDYLYGIASQTYFSIPGNNSLSVAQLLDSARHEITAQIDETGEVNEAGRMQWIAEATAWNLPGGYFSYEGGPHPEDLGSTENVAKQIEAERDSMMGEHLKYNYKEAFLDLGGTLAMHFTLSGAYTRYGCFGLTDDISVPHRNYKFQAIMDLTGGSAVEVDDAPKAGFSSSVWPNPFNPSVCVSISHDVRAAFIESGATARRMPPLRISVYNTNGRMIHRATTRESYTWNSAANPAGMYIIKIQAGKYRAIHRVMLVK